MTQQFKVANSKCQLLVILSLCRRNARFDDMNSCIPSKLRTIIEACIFAISLAASPTAAQQPESATINGQMSSLGAAHSWTMSLHGLSYSHEFVFLEYYNPENYRTWSITRVYAESVDLDFQGPHADELNANVSEPLENAHLPDVLVMEMRNVVWYDYDWGLLFPARDWVIEIKPADYLQGLHLLFYSKSGLDLPVFPTDANGYPRLAPFTSFEAFGVILDRRPGSEYSVSLLDETLSVNSVNFSLPGDYNRDGTVDAADYVVWRNSPNNFGGDPAGYNTWRTNFGRTAGDNASLAAAANTAAPEPSSLGLILFFALAIPRSRRVTSASAT
jgi:hypothetical protein